MYRTYMIEILIGDVSIRAYKVIDTRETTATMQEYGYDVKLLGFSGFEVE